MSRIVRVRKFGRILAMEQTSTPALDRFKRTGEIFVSVPHLGTVYPDDGGFAFAFASPPDGIFRPIILPRRLTEEMASLIPVGGEIASCLTR